MQVFADLRWPSRTGIGLVQTELVARKPSSVEIADLHVAGRIGSPLSPVRLAMQLERRREPGGVFWSPGFIPPAWGNTPRVITLHDLTHLHYYTKLHALYYELVMKPLFRKCAKIICVSNFTREEFLNWSGIHLDRVVTIHNGMSATFFSEGPPARPGFPYVLYVGNRRAYKNLHRLLTAFSISRLPTDGIRLVLTGEPAPALQKLAAELGIQDKLQFSGPVTDVELARLYRGARAVALVSLYEGFGLPILEAMAAGTPVLTSNVSAMPEIAGDAALQADPTSIDQIILRLEQITYDEMIRTSLIERGHLNICRFSWAASAERTWETVCCLKA